VTLWARIAASWLACIAATLGAGPSPARAATGDAMPIVTSHGLFTDDDLLLLETRLGNTVLTDTLGAYSSRAGVFLPLGELARLLDLAIMVDPPEHSASGWFLAPERGFVLDLRAGTAEFEGRLIEIGPTEAMLFQDELYVRVDTLGRIVPMSFETSRSDSSLRIVSTERMPFEQRREREQRRGLLGADSDRSADRPTLRIDTPYAAFSPPAIDANLGVAASSNEPKQSTQWSAQLAGDLGWMGLQGYVSSDTDGTAASARLLLERRSFARDRQGRPIGPTVGAGDVYTPTLNLGMSSRGGRGFSYSSSPRTRANVFDNVDLRGPMPAGYEAELYVNEVLRASQPVPVQGLYEFLDVPLVFGLNVIRVVFYGPRGERYEDVRRVNVGGGQLAAGQTSVDVGAVEQGVPMVDLQRDVRVDPTLLDPGHGDVTYSATVTHGFTGKLTGRLGTGRYTPYAGDTRDLLNAGLAAAFGGVALQLDHSQDSRSGYATSLGIAGRAWNLPTVLRHAEYGGGYADELSGSGISDANPLRRLTELRGDLSAPLPGTQRRLPATLSVRYDERIDGTRDWNASAQVTASVRSLLLSSGLGYLRQEPASDGVRETLMGSLDAGTVLGGLWQVKANLAYDVVPEFEAVASSLTIDRNLTTRTALRLGVQQAWTGGRYTTLSTGMTWRLAVLDVTLGATYAEGLELWSAGVQFSAGTLFDPLQRRYRGVRPGTTVGGALALEAFIDANGDGMRQSGEVGLAGLRAHGSTEFAPVAGESGRLLVTGLGDSGVALVGIDLQSIDDPYLKPPAEVVEVVTRPGRAAVGRLPFGVYGEVTVRFVLDLPQGGVRGLSAVDAELVDTYGKVVARGRTEYDGTVLFEGLGAGSYMARIAPEQASRLGLLLDETKVDIGAGGGYAGTFDARVSIRK
jgi:hypothetical protein